MRLIRDGEVSIRLLGWDRRIKWFTEPVPALVSANP